MAVLGNLLFSGLRSRGRVDLSDVLRAQEQSITSAVDRIGSGRFAEQSDEELADEVCVILEVEPLKLNRSEGRGEVTECEVGVSDPFNGGVKVKGLRVRQVVPFVGDEQLWQLRPNQYDLNPPYGEVWGSSLMVGMEVRESEKESAIQHIKDTLNKIELWIERQSPQIEGFNSRLRGLVLPLIAARRERLKQASDLTDQMKGL